MLQPSETSQNNPCLNNNKNSDSKAEEDTSKTSDAKDDPSNLLCLIPSIESNLTPRWKNWFLRGQSGVLLMSSFSALVAMGPLGMFLLTYIGSAYCFHEVMALGYKVTKNPPMKLWCWALFFLSQIHMSDPSTFTSLPINLPWKDPACYLLYIFLIVWFILSIRNTDECLTKYCLLAWAHMAVLYISFQAMLLVKTIHHGIVWYVFSMSIITVNDIAAYMFGFFMGSTPLINLSPKKTWEGFVGGGMTTMLVAPFYGAFLIQFPHLVCPSSGFEIADCDPQEMELFSGERPPFLIHCVVISLFASTLGPAAGFFCSGFKRACNEKNFGSLIPGHGGVMDRCDCMFVMASFTYIYTEYIVNMF